LRQLSVDNSFKAVRFIESSVNSNEIRQPQSGQSDYFVDDLQSPTAAYRTPNCELQTKASLFGRRIFYPHKHVCFSDTQAASIVRAMN